MVAVAQHICLVVAAALTSGAMLTSVHAQTSADVLPPGHARFYVFRPLGIAGAAGSYPVFLDGRAYGQLGNGQFFRDALPSGEHVISIGDFTSSAQRFTARAGNTYGFVVSYVPLKMFAPYSIEAISADEAKKYAQDLTLNDEHRSTIKNNLLPNVADPSLNCQQLRIAISDAKAAKEKAEAQRGGTAVGGFVAGIILPGALGNSEMMRQQILNQEFDAAKAQEDKLRAIYRKKNCRG